MWSFFVHVVFFFFSSRRRHTRLVSDWSSDVCSSDLRSPSPAPESAWRISRSRTGRACWPAWDELSRWASSDRKSVVLGKSVDLGGRGGIKKKKETYSRRRL